MPDKLVHDPTMPLRPRVPAMGSAADPRDSAAQAEVERRLAALGDPESPESKAMHSGRKTPAEIAETVATWLADGELPKPSKVGPEVETSRYGRGGADDDAGDFYGPGSGSPAEIAARAALAAEGKPPGGKLSLRRYSRDDAATDAAGRITDEHTARRLSEFFATRVNV